MITHVFKNARDARPTYYESREIMETYLICLAVAVLVGLMLSRLTKLLNLPAVTAYLVAGLLIGPFFLGRLDVSGLEFIDNVNLTYFS